MNTRFWLKVKSFFPRLRRKKLIRGRKVFSIAHRGGAGLRPENTLAAFQNAINLGADFIELDLHRSKDGHLVVIHDPEVDYTTDGKGKVCELTLAELKQLDAGVKFSPAYREEKIPTLKEVLQFAKDKISLAIEIKEKGIEQQVLNTVAAHKNSDIIIISFHPEVIKNFRLLSPKIPTGLLFRESLLPVDYISRSHQVYANILDLEKGKINYDLIQHCHKNGLLVWTWVVDRPGEMRDLIQMGVDGIATNYPDRLLEILVKI